MTPQELTEALMVSVSSNDLEKTKQILSLGTDPNTAENATSATPLFTAIANNNPQMVQMLLDHGADVNQVNEKGSYPMHEVASGNGFVGDSKYRANEMIQSLIEHGADVNQKNAKGQTPIMLACKAGRTETLIFLLNKNAKTSIQDEKGKTVGDYSSEVPAKSCSDALRKFTKEVL
jgi:ankyrin repeat protein